MTFKQNLNQFILAILVLTSLISCTDESTGGRILPENTGRHSEILVVADSAIWQTASAQSLRDIYQEDYPLLLKTEPFFKLIVFKEKDFSSIIKTHKNVLILTESDSINEIKTYQDRWAKEQQVLYIQLKDDEVINKQIKASDKSLFDYFYKADLERIAANNVNHKLGGLYFDLQKKKGIEFIIPQDFFIVKDTTDFVWVRREKPHLTESITYFEEDYVDENQFTLDNILNSRDSIYKIQVEGSIKNSYMTTERRFEPVIDTIEINNEFAVRTRGWWRIQNDFMGGYFVRYTLPDLDRRKLIHIEAFLYCPKYNKMFYLRELEAILNSFEFTKNTEHFKKKKK